MDKARDQKTLYILKTHTLSHLIANTSLGPLELKLDKTDNKYFFTLDAVPVGKVENEALLKLYGIEQ